MGLLKSTRKLNIQILLFFSYFSSWVKELKHSMVNWLTQHISYQEQENPSEQGRKSARLLNTSLCSLNRLLRKLQVLLVILGPGLNLEVRRSFFWVIPKKLGWEFSRHWHVLFNKEIGGWNCFISGRLDGSLNTIWRLKNLVKQCDL